MVALVSTKIIRCDYLKLLLDDTTTNAKNLKNCDFRVGDINEALRRSLQQNLTLLQEFRRGVWTDGGVYLYAAIAIAPVQTETPGQQYRPTV